MSFSEYDVDRRTRKGSFLKQMDLLIGLRSQKKFRNTPLLKLTLLADQLI